jgi:hypothetical protein
MKAYFLNIPNEERQNILNQHKHVYDGYTTNYANSSEQPLFVQDFANDKGGITVNNKGEVKKYTNLNINEEIDEMQLDMIGDSPDYSDRRNISKSGDIMPEHRLGLQISLLKRALEDGSDVDFIHNNITKILQDNPELSEPKGNSVFDNLLKKYGLGESDVSDISAFDEEIYEDEIPTEDQDEKEPFEIDVDFYDELGDEQMNENVKSQISESLKWFKKFTKYN